MKTIALTSLLAIAIGAMSHADPLPGTQPLEAAGDLSAKMVAGIDQWLVRETSHAAEERARTWQAATGDHAKWDEFTKARREELRSVLGIVDARTPGLIEEVSIAGAPAEAAHGKWSAAHVRWPVFPGVHGEGVLFRPATPPRGVIIIVPDADQIPEHTPHATEFAAQGFFVLVPVLVDRRDNWSGVEAMQRFTNQPHREWIYRQSFEMGRTVIGYEAQKVFAALDALRAKDSPFTAAAQQMSIVGYGEGGLIALISAALDERVKAAAVSGYFGPHDSLYSEPIYRNGFGLLRNFGNAELAALMTPRRLFIDPAPGPKIDGPPPAEAQRKGAAPGGVTPFTSEQITAEKDRADAIIHRLGSPVVTMAPKAAPALFAALGGSSESTETEGFMTQPVPTLIDARQQRTVRELEAFTQGLIDVAERDRTARIWAKIKPGAEWDATQRALHESLWRDSIGKIEADFLPPNPRTRLLYETEKLRAYEVTLDVFPDVFAWGWLLVPKDLKPGERRPVVVCQHGLEGVPEDTVNPDPKGPAYHFYKGFATQLAEQGFITYAPHNPYRGQDNFRVLQRRANPLGLSLFSFILAQHDVTTQWLAGLPFVDPQRIGFYGLSYGGKSAMRLPALLDRYCLSICSGDFNEWIRKVVSTNYRGTYMTTGEYEMPEWNLANTANYAEMAMLIAPRPFMVERGHDDGVGMDEWVGYEFAKVRRGYDKLGIGDRAEIEWFDGPHTIHGVGTFEFLHKHLNWPQK
ncbi:MAG: dienelactone hydrolase family protein [Chthoniobacter sp.]|uniref:dienelactone hydrolase family protein n=1 Tax=Chthoniobacter sp. TaxID=2510640 RepID=UPI0032A88289